MSRSVEPWRKPSYTESRTTSKRYCENPWYVALLPDDEPEVARLLNNDIRNFPSAKYRLPEPGTRQDGAS